MYFVCIWSCKNVRVGGEENFFHCNRCDMCLGIQLKDSHKVGGKSYACKHNMGQYMYAEGRRGGWYVTSTESLRSKESWQPIISCDIQLATYCSCKILEFWVKSLTIYYKKLMILSLELDKQTKLHFREGSQFLFLLCGENMTNGPCTLL